MISSNSGVINFILLVGLIYLCDYLEEALNIKDKHIFKFILRAVLVFIYFMVVTLF